MVGGGGAMKNMYVFRLVHSLRRCVNYFGFHSSNGTGRDVASEASTEPDRLKVCRYHCEINKIDDTVFIIIARQSS